jgi:hypothetical protein
MIAMSEERGSIMTVTVVVMHIRVRCEDWIRYATVVKTRYTGNGDTVLSHVLSLTITNTHVCICRPLMTSAESLGQESLGTVLINCMQSFAMFPGVPWKVLCSRVCSSKLRYNFAYTNYLLRCNEC